MTFRYFDRQATSFVSCHVMSMATKLAPTAKTRGRRHGTTLELLRTISTVPTGVCVTSALIAVESHSCAGCDRGLSAPALTIRTPKGESWWCEECVRRTLQAIQESSEAAEGGS